MGARYKWPEWRMAQPAIIPDWRTGPAEDCMGRVANSIAITAKSGIRNARASRHSEVVAFVAFDFCLGNAKRVIPNSSASSMW